MTSLNVFSRQPGLTLRCLCAAALALLWGARQGALAEPLPSPPTGGEADFMPAIHMAPFVVSGETLSLSVHARSTRDRRYAERFGEEVLSVAYDTMGHSTGRGLVIVGYKGEPHPLYVFKKFIAMAGAGQLDPAVARRATELSAELEKWEGKIAEMDNGEDLGLTFDMVVGALPLRLKDTGSKLYQWAWLEDFNVERVELKFHALREADFAQDQLAVFDWVFYLPPSGAFDAVLDRVLPKILAKEEMGLFQRAAVRSALFVFKPVIRKAVEGMRKGMLFRSVLEVRGQESEDDLNALTEAYMAVLMPDMKFNDDRDTTHARAMEAIEAQKRENADYARNPFVSPARLEHADPTAFAPWVGTFASEESEKRTRQFSITEAGTFHWRYQDKPPEEFYAAGDRLLVSAQGDRTLEFLRDETGAANTIELRRKRHRTTLMKIE